MTETEIDLTETEDKTETDEDADVSEYNDISAQDDNEESVEEIELDDDEEWVEQEVKHMYSTFASEIDVFSTQSNKIGIAAYYLNALSAPEDLCWAGKD